jgi:hypothetical protein
MELVMKYSLSLFDGSAFIEQSRKQYPTAWLRGDGNAGVLFPRGSVYISIEHLAAFAASLPMQVDMLNKQPKRGRERHTECEIENGKIRFSGDASNAVKHFSRVFNRIWPLLELARCMLEQMNRCPLRASVASQIFVPKQKLDGVPVKDWLASRKEAALKIDPETALISRAYVYSMNPYGVYSNIPDHAKEVTDDHYVRSPGSKIWVYRGDLPKETARALEEKHELNVRLVSYYR